jgi:predicted transcriptional regulator of viral defense system
MESLSLLEIYKIFKENKIVFFDFATLSKLTNYNNKNTLYKIAQKLERKKLIKRLSLGMFLFSEAEVSEFEIANYVYSPSYISLESALSIYGILSQFPYTITSITTRKSKKLLIEEKEYQFSKIDETLFWGYEKKGNFLIASAEKALLDSIYFFFKGLVNIDYAELDLSIINKNLLFKLVKEFNSDQIYNKVKEIVK